MWMKVCVWEPNHKLVVCLEDIFKERLGIRQNKANEKLENQGDTAMPYDGESDADEVVQQEEL